MGLAVVYLLAPLAAASLRLIADGGARPPPAFAPAAQTHPGVVIQFYAAPAKSWRAVFAVHTWLAFKPEGGRWERYETVGWGFGRYPALRKNYREHPDRHIDGAPVTLLLDLRGDRAARLLPTLRAAIDRYPAKQAYRVWPGPNSNTFVGWLGRAVPDLGLELPATAIGKDFLLGRPWSHAPSGAGWQISAWGIAGVLIAPKEGIELNVLGAVFGLDLGEPAIKLPGLGRLGWSPQAWRR